MRWLIILLLVGCSAQKNERDFEMRCDVQCVECKDLVFSCELDGEGIDVMIDPTPK